MWTMTTIGFFSAVQHRDDPDDVLVRARCKEDIDALAELIPGTEPWEDLKADYRWRLRCSKMQWAETVAFLALSVDYDNFKSAVESEKHHEAYSEVWGVLWQLQYPRFRSLSIRTI